MRKTKNELKKLQAVGFYRDMDLVILNHIIQI